MEVYVKIFFTALIAGFILSIVFAIIDSWWWLLLWPTSWVALGLAACVDFSVGNVDNYAQPPRKESDYDSNND